MKPLRVYVIGAIGALERREERCRKGIRVGEELIKLGFAPMMQHFYTARERLGENLDRDDLLSIDAAWLRVSDVAIWDKLICDDPSTGGEAEVKLALSLRIKVCDSIEELIEWRKMLERTHPLRIR